MIFWQKEFQFRGVKGAVYKLRHAKNLFFLLSVMHRKPSSEYLSFFQEKVATLLKNRVDTF